MSAERSEPSREPAHAPQVVDAFEQGMPLLTQVLETGVQEAELPASFAEQTGEHMTHPKRTLELIAGALFGVEAAWRGYLPEAQDWKHTAVLLTAPLIVVTTLIAYLIGALSRDGSAPGFMRPTLSSSLTEHGRRGADRSPGGLHFQRLRRGLRR